MTRYAAPGSEGAIVSYQARYDHFIGGEYVAPARGQYFENPSPVNGQPFTEIARGTAEDVERALDAAHAAAPGWGRTSVTERSDILLKIVLPLSKAVVAVVALFYAVSYWNDFFNALLYLNDSSMWPLQLVLRLYVVQGAPLPSGGEVSENAPPLQSIQMAVVVIAMIPILCVYPFLQRYFTRGVLSGAIKG